MMATYYVILLCVMVLVNLITANNYNIRINIGNSRDDQHPKATTKRQQSDSRKRDRDIAMDYYDDSLSNFDRNAFDLTVFQKGRKENKGLKKIELNKRSKRSINYGGYTNNPDACQMYNHNLLKLWTTLSKYIHVENHEVPNKLALHNIAIIIQAYLEHQDNENNNEDNNDININDNKPNITTAMDKINTIINGNLNVDSVGQMIEIVVNAVDKRGENEDCAKKNRQKVTENVKAAFLEYLNNSDCRRANLNINIGLLEHPKIHSDRITKNDAHNFLRYLLETRDVQNCLDKARQFFLETMKSLVYGFIEDRQCLSSIILG